MSNNSSKPVFGSKPNIFAKKVGGATYATENSSLTSVPAPVA